MTSSRDGPPDDVSRSRETVRGPTAAADALPGMVYRRRSDAAGTVVSASDGCAALTGYEREVLERGTVGWADVVHPADRDALPGTADVGERFRRTYRIETREGETVRVRDEGRVETREDGESSLVGYVTEATPAEAGDRRDELHEELDAVVERISDGVFALDCEWNITFVNDRGADLIGSTPADLVGESLWDAYPEAVGTTFEAEYRRALETQEPVTFEEYFPPLETWYAVHAYPSETGLSVYYRDITDRKRYEEALTTLQAVTTEFPHAETPAAVSGVLAEGATKVLPVTGARVYLRDEGRLRRMTTAGETPIESGRSTAEVDLAAEALGEAEPVVHEDLRGVVPDVEAPSRATFVPIGDRGVLVVYDRNTGPFDGQTVELAAVLGTSAGAELVRVERETELRERERELRRYETIVETVGAGIYTVDDRGRFTYVNDTYASMVEYETSELVGSSVSLVVDEETRREAKRLERELREDDRETATLERTFEVGGTKKSLEATFALFPDGGTERVSVVRDVTDRRARERELERYRTIVETVWDGVYALDEDERFVMANDEFLSMTGYEREALLGEHASVVYDDEVAERVERLDEEFARGERDGARLEFELTRADGETVPVESRFGHYEYGDGQYGRMGIVRDITEYREREREVKRQHEELSTLNQLNDVVGEITHAVVESSNRTAVEELVCEKLTATESYEFAWVGEVSEVRDDVRVRAESGTGQYLDGVSVSVGDNTRERGPVGRAVRRQETQVTRDVDADPTREPWEEQTNGHGYRSSAAIPIQYEGVLYGALCVYSDRADAFDEHERRIVSRLGEIIGHAITAIGRKEALIADQVVELELEATDLPDDLATLLDDGASAVAERTVPLSDSRSLVYYRVRGMSSAAFLDAVASTEGVENARCLSEVDGEARVEVRVSSDTLSGLVATHGGRVRSAELRDGRLTALVELPERAPIRKVLGAFRDSFPGIELVSQRTTERWEATEHELRVAADESLSAKQRQALEVGYHAGFFEWPRESTGEEVAEALGVSPPTFHQHLRKGERKLVGALVDRPAGADAGH